MRHIVFLLGSYYPNFSAVGYCVHQVIKCLKKDSEITVIAFRNDSSQLLEDGYEGIKILRIETEDIRRRNLLRSLGSRIARLRTYALRARGALKRLLAPETVDQSLISSYVECLNSLLERPSTVVPVVFPFETILAALEYKKTYSDVKMVPYLFDNFVDSGSLHVLGIAGRVKRKRHLRLEREMLSEADAVVSMQPLRVHFERYFEASLVQKIAFVEHPLLAQPEECAPRSEDGMIRLCFAGSLIRNVREPSYLVKLLRGLRVSTKVHADFFVMGNAADRIRTQTLRNSISIVNHGCVPKREADAAVFSADILLNIGEIRGKQISSKIFEYISTGKPIVHLAYVENDAVTEILRRYPLALCLIQDRLNFERNLKSVEEFIVSRMRCKISFAEVSAIYPEAFPEITARTLLGFEKSGRCLAQ